MRIVNPSRDPRRPSIERRRLTGRLGRERTEDVERATLSTWAVAASESKGRERPEPSDPHRTVFQVDRDRVTRASAFARLAGKGVDVPAHRHPSRMEQAGRVAAAASWLARSLGLNPDLTEVIAHASVLGAPPFADAGCEAITSLVGHPFSVGDQSLRVVERLEGDGLGLNLSWEARDGIVHAPWEQTPAATCEGQAVRLATRVVTAVDAWAAWGRPELSASARGALGEQPDAIVRALLGDVIAASGESPELVGGELVERFHPEILGAAQRARAADSEAAAQHERAAHVVSSLVVFDVERSADADLRRAVDRVCAWSDAEALATFRERFEPAG